jgi:DNA-binding CsgD family transcriptional regulator
MLTATYENLHFAGMIDNGVEFFAEKNTIDVRCINNGTIYNSFNEFPEWIKDKLSEDLSSNLTAIKALKKLKGVSPDDYLKHYTFCKYGGLDPNPDIDVNGVMGESEYFECGFRGKCKAEGKLCCTIKVKNGHLTKREIEVVKKITRANKIIADLLHMTESTVTTHIQKIMKKTGCKNRGEIIFYGTKKGIIKWIW